MLAGSMAGYAEMKQQQQQQHGAERRMEEAMAESITITCRRDEETEPCRAAAERAFPASLAAVTSPH